MSMFESLQLKQPKCYPFMLKFSLFFFKTLNMGNIISPSLGSSCIDRHERAELSHQYQTGNHSTMLLNFSWFLYQSQGGITIHEKTGKVKIACRAHQTSRIQCFHGLSKTRIFLCGDCPKDCST